MTTITLITLITDTGSVRVSGEGLVIDLRASEQRGGNGPRLPDETATEKQAACLSRLDQFEKPATSSQPVTAPEPSTASPEARAPNSTDAALEPSVEACAGGPVSAQATQLNSLECGADKASTILATAVSSSVGARQAGHLSISDCVQDRAPTYSDPGPIPSFMRRARA